MGSERKGGKDPQGGARPITPTSTVPVAPRADSKNFSACKTRVPTATTYQLFLSPPIHMNPVHCSLFLIPPSPPTKRKAFLLQEEKREVSVIEKKKKMVRDGCEPPLHLSLGSSQDCSSAESNRVGGSSANSEANQQQQQQQITIFYNGRICVCDVTELQARAIISMAKREMDDRMKKNQLHQQQQHEYQQKNTSPPQTPASSPQAMPQLLSQGLLTKRSLQRFLQKRKTRIDAASPYNYRREILFSSTS